MKKYPTDNEFLDGMKRIDGCLQEARHAYGRIERFKAEAFRQAAQRNCHEKLESAHDALVTLLGMFAEEPQPVVTDMCQVAESL